MSVGIAGCWMRNMPVEVLILGEKSCGIIIYKQKASPVEECDR